MCGISGEIIFRPDRRIDAAVLAQMRDEMAHRGPDDKGQWISPNGQVGMGHRRLSIVDLSPAGHQPMSNEDGSIWIVFNGEIYNHSKLRPALEKSGHRYRSHTDTETIIHLYEEHGPQCVDLLDGMFAFAIWDANKQQMLLARDRLGKKPVYFWRDHERLIFASEIKSLLRHPAVPKQPNLDAIYHYLSLSATPCPMTLFAGVHKLRPAEVMTVEAGGQTQTTTFWNPFSGTRDAANMSETECAQRVLDLLRNSVAKRMMSDVPFGVFLSGGVDSSTNVALMSQLMTRPVDTFTVALAGDEESNEFNWARQTAKHFQCNHHEIVVQPQQFLDFLDAMAWFQDEPLSDPVCVPLYYVSKLARDNGVIVVQVGEGSDEIFAGYNGYRTVLNRQRWAERWRRGVPGVIQNLAVQLAPARQRDFLRRLRDDEEIFWGGAIAFYETEKRAMLGEDFLNRVGNLSTWSVLAALYQEAREAAPEADFLHQMIYVELRQRLAELLLMRVDKMSMATSVEARVPFLDIELVEFAMHIPSAFKIRGDVGKAILKQAVRPILPAEVVDRPKRGFCGSAANMLEQQINDRMLHDIRSSPFLTELLRPAAIAALTSSGQDRADRFKMWNLWNLHLWHERWFS